VGERLSSCFVPNTREITATFQAAISNRHFAVRIHPGHRGYISPYFITNAEKMRVGMDDPYLLIYEKKLSGLQELLLLLEAVVQTSKPLVIVAEDIAGEALGPCRQNGERRDTDRFS
jgi:hypothetical protein